MTRNVTITNNAPRTAVALFQFTSGDSFHCGVGGIRFNETASGTGNPARIMRITGGGSKVPLIYDCAFQVKDRISARDRLGRCVHCSLLGMRRHDVELLSCGPGFNTNPGMSVPLMPASRSRSHQYPVAPRLDDCLHDGDARHGRAR